MSTIELDHEHADAIVMITKGAPDVLLERCARVRVGMEVVKLDEGWRARILADVDALSDAALRTLPSPTAHLVPMRMPRLARKHSSKTSFTLGSSA